jgi:hypothetical protein
MSETTSKTGEVNLAKLLKRTQFHPKGRVQIDEATGEIKNSKNPKAGKAKMTKIEDGQPIQIEVDVFRGIVKGENSVWRVSMCKPVLNIGGQVLKASCPEELYHQMTLLYEKRSVMGKARDDFRPELSEEETKAYLEWKKKTKVSNEKDDAALNTLSK